MADALEIGPAVTDTGAIGLGHGAVLDLLGPGVARRKSMES